MVNIITKKGAETSTPFTLTVENGSCRPLTKNWLSLVDSQRVDLSYSNNNLFATVGTTLAQNAYLYDNNTTLRENAHLYEGHGSVSYSQEFSPELTFSTNNIVSYKNLGVPGVRLIPDDWFYGGLTPNDYQISALSTMLLNHHHTQVEGTQPLCLLRPSTMMTVRRSEHNKHNAPLPPMQREHQRCHRPLLRSLVHS